jgi:hypothetical protein
MFSFGVKPSPDPAPHSFQKVRPGMRDIAGRAAPIIAKAQSLAGRPLKRNNVSVTVSMGTLRNSSPQGGRAIVVIVKSL